VTSDDHYSVYNSGEIAENFRLILDEAKRHGKLSIVLQTARWTTEELVRTPSEYGESRTWLPDAHLMMRCAFARPLMVEYAVHER